MPINGVKKPYKDRYTFASKRHFTAGSVVHFASAIYTSARQGQVRDPTTNGTTLHSGSAAEPGRGRGRLVRRMDGQCPVVFRPCRRRAFAENELRRIEVQRAAFALRCLFRHLRQFRCVGAFNTAYQFAGFRIQGRAGEWFPSALLAYPARRPVHLDPGRNNAVDPAKILAVTFQGVLRTVRWRPQPVPGLFRDLPIVRLRYCAGCGRDRDSP
jgi:hypothetical protein